MSPHYQPNGVPLTPHESEILVVLIEECGEVIQAATKLLRFGKENRPDDGGVGAGEPNTVVLSKEVGDLRYLLTMVRDAGLTEELIERQAQERKHDRLRWFMQTQGP
jgi:hypothetical protein